jgi:hypothetical protein
MTVIIMLGTRVADVNKSIYAQICYMRKGSSRFQLYSDEDTALLLIPSVFLVNFVLELVRALVCG